MPLAGGYNYSLPPLIVRKSAEVVLEAEAQLKVCVDDVYGDEAI